MKWVLQWLCVLAVLMASSCLPSHKDTLPPLQVVPKVDLKRYAGTWYEVASYPTTFQRGCLNSRATYTLRDDGSVSVVNQCNKGSDGGLSTARGRAKVADPETNAKLSVSFFWPFSGDYWIIDLGDNYEYAVVGHPSREYLWILSRTPQMDGSLYEAVLQRLRAQSYDTSKLVKTPQQSAGGGP